MTREHEDYLADQSRMYLEHVRRLVSRKDVWALTIEQDEALLDGLKGIDYTREKVDGGGYVDKVADILDRLEANRAQHRANMAELVDVVEDAQMRIGCLSPTHARLLMLRYVSDMPWRDVAERMLYSEAYCKQELHQAALVEMHGQLPTEWRNPEPRAV